MSLSVSDFSAQIKLGYPSLVVPKKVPGSYFGRVAKLLKETGITVEDAYIIGQWLGKQTWITAPLSIMVVAQKAGEWLAKALSTVGVQKKATTTRNGIIKAQVFIDVED